MLLQMLTFVCGLVIKQFRPLAFWKQNISFEFQLGTMTKVLLKSLGKKQIIGKFLFLFTNIQTEKSSLKSFFFKWSDYLIKIKYINQQENIRFNSENSFPECIRRLAMTKTPIDMFGQPVLEFVLTKFNETNRYANKTNRLGVNLLNWLKFWSIDQQKEKSNRS